MSPAPQGWGSERAAGTDPTAQRQAQGSMGMVAGGSMVKWEVLGRDLYLVTAGFRIDGMR